MAIQTFTHNFKVTRKSPIAEQIGQTREPLEVSYTAIEGSEIADLNKSELDQIAYLVNNQIELYAKRLIAENSTDWNYTPDADSLTFSTTYDDLTKPSQRGNRILSKANLEAFAEFYIEIATGKLGKSANAARNAGKLIETKFASVAGNLPVIAALTENFVALAEYEIPEHLESIYNALIDLLASLADTEISALDL